MDFRLGGVKMPKQFCRFFFVNRADTRDVEIYSKTLVKGKGQEGSSLAQGAFKNLERL